MIQEIMVLIIGLSVLLYIGYRIYSIIWGKNKNNSICGCANCHCNDVKKANN